MDNKRTSESKAASAMKHACACLRDGYISHLLEHTIHNEHEWMTHSHQMGYYLAASDTNLTCGTSC